MERLERLAELVDSHIGRGKVAYCGKAGDARGSCVEIHVYCAEDRVWCREVDASVALYGPHGRQALEELMARLEEIERLKEEWKARIEEFEKGAATLADVLGAKTAYVKALERLREDIKKSVKAFTEALGKDLDSYDFAGQEEEEDACQRLIDAINDVIEYPEVEG